MIKCKSKKIAKAVLVFALVASTVVGLNPSAVFAGSSDSYSLYFNSPNGTNGTSKKCSITYYAGANYFAVDGLSGSSPVKIVKCSGINVNMSAVQRTSVGTMSFTYVATGVTPANAEFMVTITNDGSSTMYANGRVYHNVVN